MTGSSVTAQGRWQAAQHQAGSRAVSRAPASQQAQRNDRLVTGRQSQERGSARLGGAPEAAAGTDGVGGPRRERCSFAPADVIVVLWLVAGSAAPAGGALLRERSVSRPAIAAHRSGRGRRVFSPPASSLASVLSALAADDSLTSAGRGAAGRASGGTACSAVAPLRRLAKALPKPRVSGPLGLGCRRKGEGGEPGGEPSCPSSTSFVAALMNSERSATGRAAPQSQRALSEVGQPG